MITVVNKYHGPPPSGAQNVMRSAVAGLPPSCLGNPYSHMENTKAEFRVATREEAVEKFKPWLKIRMKEGGEHWRELKRLAALASAGDLALVCCCVPKACHANAVKDAIDWLLANPSWQPLSRARAPRG